MFCPKCGTENLDNARFCKKCRYEFPEKGPSLTMAKEGLLTAKEKLVPMGKKVLPFMSKVGSKLSLFCKSTLIPLYQRKIKPNPKPFLIALLILLLLGGGFLIFQQKSSSKKVSEVSSLESLAKRFEIWTQSYGPARSSSKEVFGKWLKEGLGLATQYKKSVENYLSLAQDLNPKYPEKFKELFEKDKIIREIEGYVELSELFDLRKTKEGEMIYKIFNESQILLNKVKITKGKSEAIEAKYQEKENNKIPIGYSFTVKEPENGIKQEITVMVEGKDKGTVTIITKEPKEGVKIIGTGSQENIAKIVSNKLEEIIKLFQNQNLTAATILPFLEEESKEKAISWENEYKNTVFNWRRFDEYETIPSQVTFERSSYYSSQSKSLPTKIFLPVKVKYYQAGYWGESFPKIPFYYNKEKDEWVSTNETIEKIFNIINNQVIPTKVSPDTFTFPKTKECGLYNREVKIRQITISGKNTLKGDFSASVSSVIFGISDYQSEVNIGGTLPSDLIQKINNEKITILTGKTFKYEYSGWWSSYKCETSPNISFSFFSE